MLKSQYHHKNDNQASLLASPRRRYTNLRAKRESVPPNPTQDRGDPYSGKASYEIDTIGASPMATRRLVLE